MKFQLTYIFFFFGLITSPVSKAQNTDPPERIFNIGTVQSLVIEKENEIIAERYTGGMHAERNTNIKSASKSVLSLLVGLAIEHGYLDGVDQTIDQFFPEYFETNPDSVKETITIQDLLTMRSGLETTSFRNYGRWVLSRNWIDFTLDQPITENPGGRMIYSTGSSHLLSVIITRASGMSTRAFANRYLFDPLDIQAGGWDRDPQGYYMGGNNMALSPMDLIKIGRLVMNLGTYNNETILSREWILESVDIYTQSNFNPYNFGYLWWRKKQGDYEVFFAWGNGGQYIIMLPELDTVISITSNLAQNSGSRRYQRQIFQYLEEVLIPYIEDFS